MGDTLNLLLMIICGIILFGFGYFLFFGKVSPLYPYTPWGRKNKKTNDSDKSKYCPICRYRLEKGELVKTYVYPSPPESKDRIVHIMGCSRCLNKSDTQRKCPVCDSFLLVTDYLVSRMFERSMSKNHVHVLGCNYCRKPRRLDR